MTKSPRKKREPKNDKKQADPKNVIAALDKTNKKNVKIAGVIKDTPASDLGRLG
jgi:hypothetical protein